MLFELVWQHRFLYRDLNDLLSKNRKLEMEFQQVLKRKQRAVLAVLEGLSRGSAARLNHAQAEPLATTMVVMLTYWLSYEYVRDPRNALEPASAATSLARGAYHLLSLLEPYLEGDARSQLHALSERYLINN
jgi:hypothetical protein